jgi:UDP-N-acetylmuramyl pentapeptide phosphotransferase/UDP-N-acetylglucosamine-1-phosphate transferase
MRWLALVVSFAVALAIVPAGIRALRDAGMKRKNYRGRRVAFPLGAVLVVTSLVALAPLAVLDDRADLDLLDPSLTRWFAYAVGVAFLGLFDDTIGRGASDDTPRGWRGHAQAVFRGELSTGAIKALGALALAAYATSGLGREWFGYLVDLAILLLATNMWNLLDLRPGRAEKALLLLAAGLCIGYWTVAPIELLGLFVGPILVGAWFTLREEAMLGDTGSNLIGAVAGIWMLETLSDPGRYVALAILLLLTIYGEFRSISATIERVPLLKQLDSLGRT